MTENYWKIWYIFDLARKADKFRYELFYYKKLVEVDFVIYTNRKVTELIQVAYSVADQKPLSVKSGHYFPLQGN